jgi:hypothetical protein
LTVRCKKHHFDVMLIMSKARTVRLNKDLEKAVELFMVKNDINFNTLVNLAVREYISKPHTIELQPLNDGEWDEATNEANERSNKFKRALSKVNSKHGKALKKLT